MCLDAHMQVYLLRCTHASALAFSFSSHCSLIVQCAFKHICSSLRLAG